MNEFEARIRSGETTYGLWQALASPYSAEVCAGAGFDWLLFDGEHAPNDIRSMLAQIQAVGAYPVEPVARLPYGDAVMMKQYLDIGFRTVLVPMVDTAEQAGAVARSTMFPPEGNRGVASAIGRASRFGRTPGYLQSAGDDVCLIVQIESVEALTNVREIADVDGVDGVFFGPSDLAASMGLLGQPTHPDVVAAIEAGIGKVADADVFCGVFASGPDTARDWSARGVRFISVGTDIGILAGGAAAMASAAKTASS